MENNEKRPEVQIKPRGEFFTWLENYWYHYKWPTIIIGIAVIILSVCMWQVTTTEKHDIVMVYAGPNVLTTAEIRDLQAVVGGILPSDKDGNGKKDAAMSMYEIYSLEQMEATTDDRGVSVVNAQRNTTQKSEYENYMMTGGSSVCFLDPSLYEEILTVKSGAYLYPLSVLFEDGDMPKGAKDDGYGVRLGDTDLYREFGVIQRLSPDTVICLRSPYAWGDSSDEEKYQYEIDTFKALITYEADLPETEESDTEIQASVETEPGE